ncbi:MAG: VIT domain-containing protein, partial [Saprospiraceae bacterium]
MNKSIFYALVLVLLNVVELSAFNQLRVLDPRAQWRFGSGSIDSATIVTKPKGMYIESSIYMNLSAKKLGFSQSDSLEIVFDFDLPKEAIVTESWLWLNPTTIIKGKLLDVWTASTIYENIVKRRTDPSILKKLGDTYYQLRVFPMNGNSFRKVKITYLMPLTISNNNFSELVAPDFIKTSYAPLTQFVWIFIPSNVDQKVNFIDVAGKLDPLFEQNDPVFGHVYYKPVPLQAIDNKLRFSIGIDNPKSSYYSTFNHNNENYYQIAVNLSDLISDHQQKNILIGFDYFRDNALGKSSTLDILESKLLNSLKSSQYFNMSYVQNFDVKFTSNDWQLATPDNIKKAISILRTDTDINGSTLSMIAKSVQFIKSHGNKGSILFVSSGSMFQDVNVSNSAIEDLKKIGISSIPIHIADITVSKNCTWVQTTRYCNNEYLFTNISRLTKGSYAILDQSTTTAKIISTATDNSLGTLLNLDVYTTVTNGFSFGRFFTKQLNQYTISDYIIQVGKYTGVPPFSVVVSGFIDNQGFSYKYEIPKENVLSSDYSLKQVWSNYSIQDLEKSSSSSIAIRT